MEESEQRVKPEKNGFCKSFKQFDEHVRSHLIEDGKVAIFTHPTPDPDAIGSMMGMQFLFSQHYGKECDLFVAGEISHPQNRTMHNLLAPKLIPSEEFVPEDYCLKILVDVVPSNAGAPRSAQPFDIVIDHHVEQPTSDSGCGLFINLNTGSCCGTVYSILKHFDVKFQEDVDIDQRVATALIVGILTDTCNMLADRTTEYEHDAFRELFQFRDVECLTKIVKFKRPKLWVRAKASAVAEAQVVDGLAVVGLGLLEGKQQDLIADMADEMLTWEGVETSIVYALIDGAVVKGSVRSANPSTSAAKVCQDLGKERGGTGWGHSAMGGFLWNLGGWAISSAEEDEITEKVWSLLKERETHRIQRILRK